MNSSNTNNSKRRRGPDSDTTITKFPCKLCPKNVRDNDNAILCDLCQTWVHITHLFQPGNDWFWQQNITQVRKSFITHSKHTIF